ncbi:MAG: hypothetical protein Q9205_006148, partial [Flavoplaca limonia]
MLIGDHQPVEHHTKNGKAYDLCAIVGDEDTEMLCPIRYVFDSLPFQINWLKSQPLSSSLFWEDKQGSCRRGESLNSILLDTCAASLPLHTGLYTFRQNKYWRASEQATEELLVLFAEDERCRGILLSNNKSMASLAEEQLRSSVMDTYSRFSTYMFAEAEDKRAQLLAQCVVLIFMFDDLWENASKEIIEVTGNFFVDRLHNTMPCTAEDSPLEQRIDAIRGGLLGGDEEQGNGGAEILETLINFCHRPEPVSVCNQFASIREYLDYRWTDVGNSFTFACAKFSIRSHADQHHPALRPLLRHIGDHISIVNDIASYDKEKRNFESGKASSVINLVDVIMQQERLEAEPAKAMAYAWQLFTEEAIRRDLNRLKESGMMGQEEWRFVDACLGAARGNLFTSVVIKRYGGEGARIDRKGGEGGGLGMEMG